MDQDGDQRRAGVCAQLPPVAVAAQAHTKEHTMASDSSRLRSQVAGLMAAYAAPESLVERDGIALWLEREGARSWLVIVAPRNAVVFERFAGQRAEGQEGYAIQRCPTTPANARALRETLPWLRPACSDCLPPLALAIAWVAPPWGMCAHCAPRSAQRAAARSPPSSRSSRRARTRALAGRPSRYSPTRPGGVRRWLVWTGRGRRRPCEDHRRYRRLRRRRLHLLHNRSWRVCR